MKKIYLLLLMVCVCFFFLGCNKKEDKNFKIVTSCYPMYILTLNIVQDIPGIEVINMCENNVGCLHNFQLRSEDLKKIEKSSVFIINGAGMESFLDKILNELPNVQIIDSSAGIDLLSDNDHEHECGQECNHHHEYNPHIWVSLNNYIKQVENIADSLKRIDGSHADEYKKNADAYIVKLKSLKERISNDLSDIKSRDIITFHEAFLYFAKEFNLNVLGVINEHPGEEVDMKDLKQMIELIKSHNIKSIFAEKQYPKETAEIIASETNTKVYTLDSAVTGSNDKDAYLNAMENNLKVLKEALN